MISRTAACTAILREIFILRQSGALCGFGDSQHFGECIFVHVSSFLLPSLQKRAILGAGKYRFFGSFLAVGVYWLPPVDTFLCSLMSCGHASFFSAASASTMSRMACLSCCDSSRRILRVMVGSEIPSACATCHRHTPFSLAYVLKSWLRVKTPSFLFWRCNHRDIVI